MEAGGMNARSVREKVEIIRREFGQPAWPCLSPVSKKYGNRVEHEGRTAIAQSYTKIVRLLCPTFQIFRRYFLETGLWPPNLAFFPPPPSLYSSVCKNVSSQWNVSIIQEGREKKRSWRSICIIKAHKLRMWIMIKNRMASCIGLSFLLFTSAVQWRSGKLLTIQMRRKRTRRQLGD